MERPRRLLAAGNVQGELHLLSPWIWVRRTANMCLFQRLLEIVSIGVEHKEGAQISKPGTVALKLKDLMCEERSRRSQTYPRQCKSCILSVPNPGQEKRSRSLLSIQKQSSVSLRGTNPSPVYEALAWFCVFNSDSWSEVRCAVLFLAHRQHPETLQLMTKGQNTKAEDKQSWCGQVNWNPQGFGQRTVIHAIFIWIHQIPAGWMIERLAGKNPTVSIEGLWAIPPLWVARYISNIEHNSWMMTTVEPALEQMARSLRFLWSQRVKVYSFLYRCEIHSSIMLLLDFSTAWLQPHPLLPFHLSHIAGKCFRAQDRLMSFVCLRFPFQKFRWNNPFFQESSPKKAKKAKHFLNISCVSLWGNYKSFNGT